MVFCFFVVIVVDEEKNGTIFLQKSVAKEGTASIMATVLFCFLDFFFSLHYIEVFIYCVNLSSGYCEVTEIPTAAVHFYDKHMI